MRLIRSLCLIIALLFNVNNVEAGRHKNHNNNLPTPFALQQAYALQQQQLAYQYQLKLQQQIYQQMLITQYLLWRFGF